MVVPELRPRENRGFRQGRTPATRSACSID